MADIESALDLENTHHDMNSTQKQLILNQLHSLDENEEDTNQALKSLVDDFYQNNRWEMYTREQDWQQFFSGLSSSVDRIYNLITKQEDTILQQKADLQKLQRERDSFEAELEKQYDTVQKLIDTNDQQQDRLQAMIDIQADLERVLIAKEQQDVLIQDYEVEIAKLSPQV